MLKLSSQQKQQLNETYNLLPERGANNRLLSQAMRRLRSHRAVLPPEHTFELFRTADYVQLWIQTEACRYSKAGSCTVCNYWNGRHCPNAVEDLISWDQLPADCHTLLLDTCGSCLDPLELFLEEQDRLFAWIARHSYQKIILETHADTLDLETIQRVCKLFQRQEVFFEFGIESLSEDTLFYCLNKRLPWKSVPEIVEAVHQSGAFCIVNVLLGAPFLSRQEQVEDTLQTIQKLLGQGVDYITLFPVNIKQHTLPCFLHQHQQYDVVCGDMIVEVLTNLTADDLFRIDVAWYGEHQEEETIPPYFCPKCQAELPELIRAYNHGASAPERKCILDRMRHVRCTCLQEPAGIEQMSLYSRLGRGYDLIQKSLLSECEVN